MAKTDEKIKGKVYLVGAGPGDAGLITVRGAELLKIADCVIYDKLANSVLLSYVRQGTEIIHVPKRTGGQSHTQAEINQLLIQKATEGKTVVRLKGGDPCIFGRGNEEAAVLAEAGVEFEIVPGITAGIAAAEYAGIMLTDRNYSSQVVFVTGKEAPDKQKSNIDWAWLAKFGGTIVFYMAMENLESIAGQLTENGMSPETAVAVIMNATLPEQRIVQAPLDQISQKCKEQGVEPPAIVVIGQAAQSEPKLNWFMRKPLFGKTIVVTRDRQGNAEFAAKIIEQGGNPLEFETIAIQPLTQQNEFLHALAKIDEFDWIIFTSANGVKAFFDSMREFGKDARVFGKAQIAVVGDETAAKLAEFGIKADFVPTVFTTKELGKQLAGFANMRGKKILLLRSQLASNELVEFLSEVGAEVCNVAIYTAVTQKNDAHWLEEKIRDGRIDWITFTSPSEVRSFLEQINPDLIRSSMVKTASIGPVTTEQLQNLNINAALTASEHTISGLLAAIVEKYK